MTLITASERRRWWRAEDKARILAEIKEPGAVVARGAASCALMFAGSERGAERAALVYTLIGTAKLNDIDPQAWLADILARIADHLVHCLDELALELGTRLGAS
jgi:hypothetical protein